MSVGIIQKSGSGRTNFKYSVFTHTITPQANKKRGLPLLSYSPTIRRRAHMFTFTLATLIIGKCNYKGFHWLLKVLIITTNNYNMPNVPRGGSLGAITLPVSQRRGYSSQPSCVTVCQTQNHLLFFFFSSQPDLRKSPFSRTQQPAGRIPTEILGWRRY